MNITSQRGNIFILLLVAVGLFAALASAITRGERQSGRALDRETAMLVSNQMLQYALHLENALSSLRLAARCTPDSLGFENPASGTYTNPQSTNRCRLFHASGGAQKWISPPADANDGSQWIITGNLVLRRPSGGNTTPDLALVLMNINPDVCEALNRQFNVPSIPVLTGTYTPAEFTGTYTASSTITGNRTGCVQESSGDQRLIFYHELFSR